MANTSDNLAPTSFTFFFLLLVHRIFYLFILARARLCVFCSSGS